MNWVNAVVAGVLLGGLYALVAAGLSLVFGVMRIVNLAHGVLAVLATYGALLLEERLGWSPFLALLVVVPVLAGIGWVLQRGLLDRALRGGELAPLLVTFGLAVILQNLLLEAFSANTRRLDIGALGTASIRISDQLAIGWFPLLAALTGVVVIVGLQQFLARTRTGRAMRATSDDQETARLQGIDDRRLSALATAIALGTVAVAGVFLGARTTFDPGTGATTLIFAFEAVVIGGLGSLWGTLVGGVVLGVAQAVGAAIDPAYGILAGHLVFLAVLAFRPRGLLPRGGDRVTRTRADGATAARTDGTTPRVRRGGRTAWVGAAGAVVLVAVLAYLPYLAPRAVQADLVTLFALVVLATMWNLLAGYGGMVSVGQQAYVGLGGYGLVVLADAVGVDPFLAVPLAGVVCGLLAWPTSFLVFRLSGGYFAIGTWVVAEVVRLVVTQVGALGAGSGASLTAFGRLGLTPVYRVAFVYWLGLGLTVVVVAAVYLLMRSPLGLALTAIRDDAQAAGSSGVRVTGAKRLVYVVAAVGCGLAGALVVANTLRVQPGSVFSVDYSATMIFMVIIGGLGTIEGPLLGALVYYLLQDGLADLGNWYLVIVGVVAVAITLLAPRGLWGLTRGRVELFPIGYRVAGGRSR